MRNTEISPSLFIRVATIKVAVAKSGVHLYITANVMVQYAKMGDSLRSVE